MLKDLTVLTPPLVVCAAFLVAVGIFLRHEMRPGGRRDDDTPVDFPGDGGISEPDQEANDLGDGEDAQDPIDST